MQIIPSTAQALTEDEFDPRSLLNPEVNLLLGSAYVSQLSRRWNENIFLIVASYNAGPSAVMEWLTPEVSSDPELWVERIPFPETRIYTKKVIGDFWSYMNLNKVLCIKS